jgi:hypothetical protein
MVTQDDLIKDRQVLFICDLTHPTLIFQGARVSPSLTQMEVINHYTLSSLYFKIIDFTEHGQLHYLLVATNQARAPAG